jgi:NTP pyrophosphatase (non-canonical NTP hydrolase)
MNIENAQQQVDDWIKEHGVRYFNELTNMAQLTEEVGEVARIIARRYGEQSEKESDKNKDLGEELADVLFVVLCLANQTGINLQDAFENKLDIKTKRDHDRHQNNVRKVTIPFFIMVVLISLLLNSWEAIFAGNFDLVNEVNFSNGKWMNFWGFKLFLSLFYGIYVTNKKMK